MLYLHILPSMAGAHLVAGVPEHEEGDEDERREKHGNNCEALFMGISSQAFFTRSLIFPFGPCHTLLYKGDTRF